MIRYFRYLIMAGAPAITIYSGAQPAFADIFTPPPVPMEIQVPAGNTPYLKGHATGTQNYVCTASGGSFAWTLFGPQATLFLTVKVLNIEITQQVTTHFLSANPDENGTKRPTWQASLDTSAVWGKAAKMSPVPNAIPWLLVEVVGREPGPTGGSTLTQTTFIHRVNTTGGLAPTTGCSQATDGGKTELVPYTADYFFYKASQR
jgi:hypothetical protein